MKKVALVCDWLTDIAGAERVVLELHHMFPEAPIYTSQYDPQAVDWFNDADVRTGWLNRLPKSLRKFLPVLRAFYFSRLDLSGYDLVISSSGAEAKGIRAAKGTVHINYCHAPTHYYWRRYDEYMRHPGFGAFDWLARIGLRLLVGPLRKWDYRAAQRPDHMIANSTHTQQMIEQYYQRDSTVIFPPVDVEKYAPAKRVERKGFIVVGRQTPYKRIDLAVAACTRLKLPLTVVGDGPEHGRLLRLAGPTVIFLKNVSEEEKVKLLQTHAAFIFPNEDDFGISPVEAMAAGCPVIALQAGGALDTVEPGVSGIFFDEPTVDSLAKALKKFDPAKFSSTKVAKHAENFSTETFRQKVIEFIKKSN